MSRPAPLTDADADLTTFKDMPFEVVRFAKSDLVAFASADAVLAALMLWGSSWHSRPAGSLTNDDRALMRAAGFGRGADAAWQAVKADALRGWIECNDGRLYHPVVAEKVATAWKARLKQKHTNYLTAIRMHNLRHAEDQRDKVSYDQWDRMGRPDEVKSTAAPKPVQAEMNLENDGLLRADDEAVTRNDNDCLGAQAPQGKGREGKGREGTLDNNNNRESVARVDDGDAFDFVERADALARRAGVPHTQPASIARNIAVVREWHASGVDLATIIEPEIDRFRLNDPDRRVSSLRFFDEGIRAKVAAVQARGRKVGHVAGITGPPVAPIGMADDDDDRVRTLRTSFNGNPTLAPDKVALSIGDDDGDPFLIVHVRSAFVGSQLDLDAVRRVARTIGCDHVEVRAP